MIFTTEQLLLIIAAVGVALVNIINAWRTNAKVASVAAKADENTLVTLATDQKATTLIQKVEKVEAMTNGHLSTMTANSEKLEAKLESALKQNADLQTANNQIIDMMKSLLAAEAADKQEIVRAIEINGTSGGK